MGSPTREVATRLLAAQSQAQNSAYQVQPSLSGIATYNPPHRDGSRECQPVPAVRTFATGATRDTDENKLDFEGFLSPLVLKAFAEYMHEKRKMPDGSYRDSDNWQKGIPLDAYMKSMWRHFFAVWESYRNPEDTVDGAVEEMLALLFNVQGMLHEALKARRWLAGAPVASERLPHIYPATDDRCAEAAVVLRKHVKKGVNATVECVPARPEA